MAFLELELFEQRIDLGNDTLDALHRAYLLVPLVELGQMSRQRALIHSNDLLNLAEDNDIDDAEFATSQPLILAQLLVELDNDLFFKFV